MVATCSLSTFDELITGFRVGLAGAQGLLGIRADLVTFAKAIASGYPVAAITGRADILDLLGTGRVVHGGTYNTGVSAMAAAKATQRIFIRDNPYPKPVRDRRIARAQVDPVLGREVVEVGEIVPVAEQRLGRRILAASMEPLGQLVTPELALPPAGAFEAARRRWRGSGWRRLGTLSVRFIALWFRERWWRVSGKTSRWAAYSPSAPSPTASIGASRPRSRRSRRTSAQDTVLSR